MDHTVKGYLSRLSTERLREFLRKYDAGAFKEDFSYIIPSVRLELQLRDQSESPQAGNAEKRNLGKF